MTGSTPQSKHTAGSSTGGRKYMSLTVTTSGRTWALPGTHYPTGGHRSAPAMASTTTRSSARSVSQSLNVFPDEIPIALYRGFFDNRSANQQTNNPASFSIDVFRLINPAFGFTQ